MIPSSPASTHRTNSMLRRARPTIARQINTASNRSTALNVLPPLSSTPPSASKHSYFSRQKSSSSSSGGSASSMSRVASSPRYSTGRGESANSSVSTTTEEHSTSSTDTALTKRSSSSSLLRRTPSVLRSKSTPRRSLKLRGNSRSGSRGGTPSEEDLRAKTPTPKLSKRRSSLVAHLTCSATDSIDDSVPVQSSARSSISESPRLAKYSTSSQSDDTTRSVPPSLRTQTSGSSSSSATTKSAASESESFDEPNSASSAPLPRSRSKRSSSSSHSVSSSHSTSRSSSFSVPTAQLVKGGDRGLRNLGNTCFMNATIQCLSNVPELRDYFISQSYLQDINPNSRMKGRIADEFGKLICNLWQLGSEDATHLDDDSPTYRRHTSHYDNPAVDASAFKKVIGKFAPRFSGYGQQDAQEFLRFLLDGLEEDLNRIVVKPPYVELDDLPNESDMQKSRRWWKNYLERSSAYITDLFLGQLKSELICRSCFKKRSTFDPFMDLSIDLPSTTRGSYSIRHASESVTLNDCLEAFTQEEILTSMDQVYCPHCKTHRDFKKRLSITKLPQVLVIHLKRFSSSRRKLLTDVDFPTHDLDLSKYIDSEALMDRSGGSLYQLHGVVCHIGSLNGGHYTASCLHPETNQWRLFNDSSVKVVSANSLSSNQGYVLFYVRGG